MNRTHKKALGAIRDFLSEKMFPAGLTPKRGRIRQDGVEYTVCTFIKNKRRLVAKLLVQHVRDKIQIEIIQDCRIEIDYTELHADAEIQKLTQVLFRERSSVLHALEHLVSAQLSRNFVHLSRIDGDTDDLYQPFAKLVVTDLSGLQHTILLYPVESRSEQKRVRRKLTAHRKTAQEHMVIIWKGDVQVTSLSDTIVNEIRRRQKHEWPKNKAKHHGVELV